MSPIKYFHFFQKSSGNIVNAYVLSFNRLTVLKKTVSSLLKLLHISHVVIIDNGSDYAPLLGYLKSLKENGSTVYFSAKISEVNGLNHVRETIEKHKRLKPCDFFVVTDPDVDLDGVPSDYFDVAAEFFSRFSNISIVGPMLRIDDIPPGYGAREFVYQVHGERFWSQFPQKIVIGGKEIFYQFAPIDTTMGLFRGKAVFRRLLEGVRMYYPYDARHLDWYVTAENIQEDQRNFIKTTNLNISHWGAYDFSNAPKNSETNVSRSIYLVSNDTKGDLKVIQSKLPV